MKKIFKRIKVNKDLLKIDGRIVKDFNEYLENETHDTIPSGSVKGVYFISYLPDTIPTPSTGEGGLVPTNFAFPSILNHTNITLKDSRGHLLTEPTDIKDYQHKNGGYSKGFKELDFESNNERISISWETTGGIPILGEFVFIIESNSCEC